jgi:cytochrome c
MKFLKFLFLLLTTLFGIQNAYSLDSAAAIDLARRSACLACHAVDRKLVGPSFQQIAARHSGDYSAVEKVAARIKSGGVGVYGPIPMPAQPSLRPDELSLLAQWILAGAPSAISPAPIQPSYQPSITTSSPPSITNIESASQKCEELGFKKGTEKFGDCVLRISK